MREILFRGKRVDNGEWVYGFYWEFYKKEKTLSVIRTELIDAANVIVKPETVGQYTGLKDKNGKKIFEGDILKHLHTSVEIKSYYEYMEVFYDEETASFYAGYEELWLICGGSEVVGNIHDNPELLEVNNG